MEDTNTQHYTVRRMNETTVYMVPIHSHRMCLYVCVCLHVYLCVRHIAARERLVFNQIFSGMVSSNSEFIANRRSCLVLLLVNFRVYTSVLRLSRLKVSISHQIKITQQRIVRSTQELRRQNKTWNETEIRKKKNTNSSFSLRKSCGS